MLRVTSVIKACGFIDDSFMDETAMLLGTYRHEATVLYDLGTLDPTTLDPRVSPHVDGWAKFRREMNPIIIATEEEVSHPAYKGRLDRRIILDGREGVLDIKTGAKALWHRLQLAGYALCFDRPMARWGLYLTDAGTYKLEEYRDRQDFETWKACVTIASFLERNAA